MIVGIDEVGRGAWAGPLCVVALGLGGVEIDGLTDSKKLSKKKREYYEAIIKIKAPLIGIGWVSAAHIDQIGMAQALKLASLRAFQQIDCDAISQIIIDGTIMLLDDDRATTMKQADLLVPSVSAASIVAKVARDRYMQHLEVVFPGYGHSKHVGYGTKLHRDGIRRFGTTPAHRMSFAPMNELVQKQPNPSPKIKSDGQRAEDVAVDYLRSRGYVTIEQNWKTKWCEIDIVAQKAKNIYFIEVKYRRKDRWGNGLEAITPKKLHQMKFAARVWMSSHPYDVVHISCISMSGNEYLIDHHIESIV